MPAGHHVSVLQSANKIKISHYCCCCCYYYYYYYCYYYRFMAIIQDNLHLKDFVGAKFYCPHALADGN